MDKLLSRFLFSFWVILGFALFSQEPKTLIAQGDALYEQRGDLVKARQAVEKYREALRQDPDSYEAHWKISKTLFYIGRELQDNEEKMGIFSRAVGEAKSALRIRPEGIEAHFWLGASYGEYGQARGILKSLFLLDDIKREMNTVIRLDEKFECGAAYIALGRVYFKVPGLFGGSNKKSRQYLEKARAMCPDNTIALLYLAETYWELGEKQLAVKTLEQLLQIVPYPSMIAEAEKDKMEARRLLQKYRK